MYTQFPIPPTQWQTEVTIWFSTSLAKLQAYIVEWATAPKHIGPKSGLIADTPNDPIGKEMCRNQMVRQIWGYQSFSVLGIALILVIGGFLILLGMLVDTVAGWLPVNHKTEHRRRQWILEEKLQLQRAAYEGFNFGTWKDKLEVVPTTTDFDSTIPPSSDVFLAGTRRDEDKSSWVQSH